MSVEFYQKINNTASDSKTRWLSIGEHKLLHLIPRPKSEIRTSKAVHFAFTAPDRDSFILYLDKLKIKYSDWLEAPYKVHIRKDGIRHIYSQDPDGYWIEVNDDI